jgi:hypothetical protein
MTSSAAEDQQPLSPEDQEGLSQALITYPRGSMQLKFSTVHPKSIHDPRKHGWQLAARNADVIINADKENGYFRVVENGNEDAAVTLLPREALGYVEIRAGELIESGKSVGVIFEKNLFDAHDDRISANKSNPLTPEESIEFRDRLQEKGGIVASIDEGVVARIREKDYAPLAAKLKKASIDKKASAELQQKAFEEKARIVSEELQLSFETVMKACRGSSTYAFTLKGLDCYFMYQGCRSERTTFCTVTPRRYDEGGPEMDLAWEVASGLYNRMNISSLEEPNLEHSQTATSILPKVKADLAELSLGAKKLSSGYRVTMQDTEKSTVADAADRAAGYCDLRVYELLVCMQVVDGEGLLLIDGRHPNEKLMLNRIGWRRQGSGKDEAGYSNCILDHFTADRTKKGANFKGKTHRGKTWDRPTDEKEAKEYDAWNASYDVHCRAIKLMFQVVRWHLWKHYGYVK